MSAEVRKSGDMTGVLLAGGQSRRMGRDKRFLLLDGRSLLERALAALEAVFPEVLVSVAEPVSDLAGLRHRVVPDLLPGAATLGGLYTGLLRASHPYVFAAACDMPFLNPAVIERLTDMVQDADVLMVRLAGRLQPTHAVYSKACLPLLERMIQDRNLKIQGLVEDRGLSVRLVDAEVFQKVDPHLLSFMNVNTPADLEFARKFLADGTKPDQPGV
jgi:molybdenum cofactor guanylyltransferase